MRLSRYVTVARVDAKIGIHSGRDGSLSVVDADDWQRVVAFVDHADSGSGLEALLEDLVRRRVLVHDGADEIAALRSAYQRSRYDGSLGLTVVTSLGCNFACSYCFEDKQPSLLRPDVADAIVRLVDDTPDPLGDVHVTWMGGEPLLGREQLFALSDRLIARCDGRGARYRAGIITNGWHLDGETAARLADHHVRRAQVTLDGPAGVHDRYRPHVNGGSTFERIVDNLAEAADHLAIAVRMNVDRGNLGHAEALLQELRDRGLAGRVTVSAARMTGVVANPSAPIATYAGSCFASMDFADVELAFGELAGRYGFRIASLPKPVATPCTAVRASEIVVGSEGELWKCWDDIGNPAEAIGTIFDYTDVNDRLAPWLAYDPFSDLDCSQCIALPGCMGGCAHHLYHGDRTERCGSFRYNHARQVEVATRRQLGLPVEVGVEMLTGAEGSLPRGTAVTLTARRSSPPAPVPAPREPIGW